MTELLYQSDSYVREFQAIVTAVDVEQGAVALDRTAFYPGGGGQPCDLGALHPLGGGDSSIQTPPRGSARDAGNRGIRGAPDRAWQVTRVAKRADQVWHTVTGSAPAAGTALQGSIDWDRRLKLMRTHTALHILCGVVWRDYGAQVTGGGMEPLRAHLDFEFESLGSELVREIERKVNAEVEREREVRVRSLLRAEAFKIPDLIRTRVNLLPGGLQYIRTVEIVGLDLQADGGTHVANTREVGRVRVADYKSKGRINKRIYLELEDSLA